MLNTEQGLIDGCHEKEENGTKGLGKRRTKEGFLQWGMGHWKEDLDDLVPDRPIETLEI